MYIFVPQGQYQVQEENQFKENFLDWISILSFMIGLKNMDLNITANDLAEQKDSIVTDLHEVIGKLDKHLVNQDRHLTEQDNHLLAQDVRLDRLERILFNKEYMERKENSK